MSLVILERAERIATVTLNRPEALNALSLSLQTELARIFIELEQDKTVDVIILTGAGERAFSAGLDLKELGQGTITFGSDSDAQDCVAALSKLTKPVIGAINGIAITGGFELALACDILIASPNARFADTHARVGVIPGWGLSQRLSRIVGISRAKQLSLTGNFIDAQTALAWGLVNEILPVDGLMVKARALAADIASADPQMIKRYKNLIDVGYGMALADALAHEGREASAYNSRLNPEALEARRGAVLDRGRTA
ncbi:enoyl-CoA hydratase [Sphingobium sp. HBC34]|uniref:Enoyl-CoA hydratase n=1 Tax=Sphingobium cyanobacteriorum TaxID=3063954 RepID=A0ABT8ZMM0_9SPHN|nr:enoyl-CoA hydratase [Sphingobium sp. HBC34]MDO7835461.1 enoyl-CoA hydratase [Sphingobium sp. HBC34]